MKTQKNMQKNTQWNAEIRTSLDFGVMTLVQILELL